MTSFQISVSPHRRAAARFVSSVHRSLLRAFEGTPEVSQTSIADTLGVHRSVISRQIRGQKDISIGRAAEIAFAMGYEATFDLIKAEQAAGSNAPATVIGGNPFTNTSVSSSASVISEVKHGSGMWRATPELELQNAQD